MTRGRIRRWLSNLRAVPGRSARLDVELQALTVALAGMQADLAATRTEMMRVAAAHSVETDRASHDARTAADEARRASRDQAAAELLLATGSDAPVRSGLSILVVTCNHAGHLNETLQSAYRALERVRPELRGEVLVLDDGSEDGSDAVLAAHADAVRVFRPSVDLGSARARNVLLALCATTHALLLDAGNRVFASGVASTYAIAEEYGPAITAGHVLGSSDDGTECVSMAYAPSAASIASGAAYNTMSIVDVEQVRALGGYTTDAGFDSSVDDYDLLLRTLRRGCEVAFVPVALGRIRLMAGQSVNETRGATSAARQVAGKYLSDSPNIDRWKWFVAHPVTGVLYGSAGSAVATRARDQQWHLRDDSAPAVPTASTRVLMVAPGGVKNLGDDAISDAVLERIRAADPHATVSVVTDEGPPLLTAPAARWLGCVTELWAGLSEDDLEGVLAQAEALGVASPSRLIPPATGPLLASLDTFDVVVFAGGGNLSSEFVNAHLVPRVAISLAASHRNVPVVWTGQGVGPCTEDEADLVRAAAVSAQAFGCRDALSVNVVNGVNEGPAVLVGDDALGRDQTSDDAIRCALHDSRLDNGPMVVFHVREASYVGAVAMQSLATAVDAYAVELGATVVGLAINARDRSEAEVFTRLAHAAPRRAPWRLLDASESVALASGLVARADAVVSHSYHVALWALAAGSPTLLVTGSDYYRAKAEGLSALAGFPGSIGLEVGPIACSQLRARLDEVADWLQHSELARVAQRVVAWLPEQLAPFVRDGSIASAAPDRTVPEFAMLSPRSKPSHVGVAE